MNKLDKQVADAFAEAEQEAKRVMAPKWYWRIKYFRPDWVQNTAWIELTIDGRTRVGKAINAYISRQDKGFNTSYNGDIHWSPSCNLSPHGFLKGEANDAAAGILEDKLGIRTWSRLYYD